MRNTFNKGRECPNCGERLIPDGTKKDIVWKCEDCGYMRVGKGIKKDVPTVYAYKR